MEKIESMFSSLAVRLVDDLDERVRLRHTELVDRLESWMKRHDRMMENVLLQLQAVKPQKQQLEQSANVKPHVREQQMTSGNVQFVPNWSLDDRARSLDNRARNLDADDPDDKKDMSTAERAMMFRQELLFDNLMHHVKERNTAQHRLSANSSNCRLAHQELSPARSSRADSELRSPPARILEFNTMHKTACGDPVEDSPWEPLQNEDHAVQYLSLQRQLSSSEHSRQLSSSEHSSQLSSSEHSSLHLLSGGHSAEALNLFSSATSTPVHYPLHKNHNTQTLELG